MQAVSVILWLVLRGAVPGAAQGSVGACVVVFPDSSLPMAGIVAGDNQPGRGSYTVRQGQFLPLRTLSALIVCVGADSQHRHTRHTVLLGSCSCQWRSQRRRHTCTHVPVYAPVATHHGVHSKRGAPRSLRSGVVH